MRLKIALMDEYALALQGLEDSLRDVPEVEIIGAYTKIGDLLLCLQSDAVDIVLIDLMLKGSRGMDFIDDIRNMAEEDVKMIVLISEVYEQIVYERALEMGVKAFLQKDTTVNELVSCVLNVGKGNGVVPDFLLQENRTKMLSETETAVLRLVVEEYTSDRIAKELFISKRTVETHVKNICKKLGVESRIGAVREAIRLKLV